jgi:hypothetical protein
MDRSAWAPPVLLRLAQVASGMMVLKASGAPGALVEPRLGRSAI